MNTSASIVIADVHPLIRAGMASLIESEDNFKLLGQASSGSQIHMVPVADVRDSSPRKNGWVSCSRMSGAVGLPSRRRRAATVSGRNFLPHHEPMIMSGLRRIISLLSAMMRFLPSDCSASSGKQSSPPAMPTRERTERRQPPPQPGS